MSSKLITSLKEIKCNETFQSNYFISIFDWFNYTNNLWGYCYWRIITINMYY